MKLQYTLFGIKTTHEFEGYTVVIESTGHIDDQVIHSVEFTKTKAGAVFFGWRLARLYAQLDGSDVSYTIYKGTGECNGDSWVTTRTIPVKTFRKVAFFSK